MSEKVSPRPATSAGASATRRPAQVSAGRRSAASAAALRAGQSAGEDYFTPGWGLMLAAYVTITLIFFLFTPYTHQLDEIKNVILMTVPPLLLAFVVWKKDFSTMTWRTHTPTFLLGIYTLVMVISYLLNPYKPIAERVVWFQVGTSTFTVLFAWFMDSEAKLRKTMMYFVLLALASTILGLVLVAGQGFTDAIYNAIKDNPRWRTPERVPWVTLFYTLKMNKEMYSSVLNSDFYAAFLVMTLPIPLSMFFVERHLLHKSIALGTFLLMNVCLFLTNSNDSFMSVALITYPLYFFLGFRYVKGWGLSRKFIITFLSGSAILGATVFVLMLPTLARTWDFKSEAISGREILWAGGFWPWLYFDDPTRSAISIKSFLFGTGPGGYRFYFPVFRDPSFFDNQINNVTTFGHNLYLDILMETGLLGLLAFLGFYGAVLWTGFQQIRRTENPVHRFYQIALVSGLTGIALQNFFSPNYRWTVCGTIYWALFGISMGLRHLDDPPAAPSTARQGREGLPWPLIWKCAVGVLAGVFLLRSPIQGLNHWKGAVANGMGLRYLDYAETTTRAGYKDAYLQEAARLFEEAIAANPTFVTSYYKLAHVYNQLGKTDEATATYEALQEMNPNYSEIHQNLAIMYSIQARDLEGDALIKKMEDSFREAVEGARQSLKPNMQWLAGSIGEELAAYYLTQGQDEKAMAVYEKIKEFYRNIIEYKPKLEHYAQERVNYYPRAQSKLVRLAELTGKPMEAEPYLQQMYRENPDAPEYLNRLTTFYDKYGKPEDKIRFLEAAVHEDPLDVELRRLLAAAYLQAGDEENHRKELRRIEILEPGDQAALSALYAIYTKAGQADKAAEYRSKLLGVGVNPDADNTTTTAVATTATTTAGTAAAMAASSVTTAAPVAISVETTTTTTTAAASATTGP